jgi:WD40 repeat protein
MFIADSPCVGEDDLSGHGTEQAKRQSQTFYHESKGSNDARMATIHPSAESCKLRRMRNRSAAILLIVLVVVACSCSHESKRALDFPLVQKYTTQAGDLFFFRPRDGQFVLLERRKALAVAVAPEPDIQAHSYEDRITVSRPKGEYLEITVFLEKIGPQQALAITADGWKLAGGDANGVVTLWDIATGNLTLQLNHRGPILSLAFSPDGKWLAVGTAKPAGEPSDTVWVYDVRSNGPHQNFGRGAAAALAWSADSRWLAAGLEDGTVLVSEAGSGGEPRRIRLSPSAITALAFHPSGDFLASGHVNKRVLVLKLAGERLYTFEPAVPPNPQFPRVIERVAFDGKGIRLAAAYAEGEFSIWDASALLQ